mmetsp:Transcript_100148/g.254739  ORF Transcript_100148/g.254739 Transcript_100148/m.254739 type:complete len:395 (+) Transcript_100148:55-1239(+)
MQRTASRHVTRCAGGASVIARLHVWIIAAGCLTCLAPACAQDAVAITALTDAKASEWLAKLRGSQAAADELEASVAQLDAKLSGAEKLIAKNAQGGISARPRMFLLSKDSQANEHVLHKIIQGVEDLQAEAQNLDIQVNTTDAQIKDDEKAVAVVSSNAEQVLSTGQFRGKHGGCLDSPEAVTAGGKVQMWACLKATDSQQWEFSPDTGVIKHMHGICLAAPDPGSNGTKVLMFGCDKTLKSQQWRYDEITGLMKSAWGFCLDTPDPNEKGSEVAIVTCNASKEAQQWNVVPGTAGLRQKLFGFNTELWALKDDANAGSIFKREQKLTALEKAVETFELKIAGHAKHVIARGLRPMARKWREAIDRLGSAASPEEPKVYIERPSLFDDLGLNGL